MTHRHWIKAVLLTWVGLAAVGVAAGDWPQWRGPNRDNKVTGFTAPAAWPKELTKKWAVKVGLGSASPVLADGKVYVFTRQGDQEVVTCVDAVTGKEVWVDKYATAAVKGPAGSHPGPRSAPTVADGKVCTLGVAGVLSCLDAATGKVVWRKDTKAWPRFYTAAATLVHDGKCIAYLGKDSGGEVTAFDLATGEEKWKWTGAGPPYGSPVVLSVAGTKQLVTPTGSSVVGINLADGKKLWEVDYESRYMNGTPILDGDTVIYSGSGAGTVALKVEKKGDRFAATEVWQKSQGPGQYNTPVLHDGMLYGITSGGGKGKGGGGKGKGGGKGGGGKGNYFCMSAKTGEVLWTDKAQCGDCGAVLDAGSVLLGLSNDMNLVAFKPSSKGYEEVARYKVADTPTWAYPIVAGNKVYVKDRESLILWAIE